MARLPMIWVWGPANAWLAAWSPGPGNHGGEGWLDACMHAWLDVGVVLNYHSRCPSPSAHHYFFLQSALHSPCSDRPPSGLANLLPLPLIAIACFPGFPGDRYRMTLAQDADKTVEEARCCCCFPAHPDAAVVGGRPGHSEREEELQVWALQHHVSEE